MIDGLALPGFAGMQDALAARGTIGLIHHPTALETGFSAEDRAMLQDIEQRLFRHLYRLVVTSDATAERLAKEFGVDPARITVVVPGTDDAPRSTGSAGPGCEILSVGTLVPRKGHDVLMRALARLFDLDWRLTIVGSPDRDPAHAAALAALAEELRDHRPRAIRRRGGGRCAGGAVAAAPTCSPWRPGSKAMAWRWPRR